MTEPHAPPALVVVESASEIRAVPPPSSPVRNRAGRVLVGIFLLALFLPAFVFEGDPYWLPLFCRFMSLAIFALSVDLVWGYTGLLTLGHGVYFGLGVYAVGYSLKLRQAAIVAARLA